MKDRSTDLTVLKAHADALERAGTFEDYQMAHVAYVRYLIANFEAQEAQRLCLDEYLNSISRMVWEKVESEAE